MSHATTQTPTPGQIAYTAYCQTREWKAYNGDLLPSFAELRADPKRANLADSWEFAAKAVLDAFAPAQNQSEPE